MTFGENCAKYVLLGLNLVFFLVSIPLLGVGIWLKADKSFASRLLTMVKADGVVHTIENNSVSLISVLAVAMIILGSICFVVGFCGCCGALKENKVLLYIYVLLITLSIGLKVALVIVTVVKKGKIRDVLEDGFQKLLFKHYQEVSPDKQNQFSLVFNSFMIRRGCCGVKGVEDFEKFDTWKASNGSGNIPMACCRFKPDFKPETEKDVNVDKIKSNLLDYKCVNDKTLVNKVGCGEVLWKAIQKETKLILAALIAVLLVEVICIVFACCVINKSYEKLK